MCLCLLSQLKRPREFSLCTCLTVRDRVGGPERGVSSLCHTQTTSVHRNGFTPSVNLLACGSAPLNLVPWLSLVKGRHAVKRQLSCKAKLFVHTPSLTGAHELWVMTQTMRSRVQLTKVMCLRRVVGVSRHDGAELLLLHIERSQLTWFEHGVASC